MKKLLLLISLLALGAGAVLLTNKSTKPIAAEFSANGTSIGVTCQRVIYSNRQLSLLLDQESITRLNGALSDKKIAASTPIKISIQGIDCGSVLFSGIKPPVTQGLSFTTHITDLHALNNIGVIIADK